jgi:hypothetical protein
MMIIVEHFWNDDETEKELDQALARSGRLRQSILKSVFEGSLVGWRKNV